MTKLCQIVAVEKSVKSRQHQSITEAYQKLQKPALLTGISRSYRSRDEDGENLPSESTRVQMSVKDTIRDVSKTLADLFDVSNTKDVANCSAKADVVVGDVCLAKDVPVTQLLTLEKKLVDIHTFVAKLPVLDPAEKWSWDPNSNAYASEPAETHRTKKVPRAFVKAAATDKHPAQVEMINDDIVVGYWKTTKFSGAMPAAEVASMLERVEKLQRAVKFAREEANSRDINDVKIGEKLVNFIFG